MLCRLATTYSMIGRNDPTSVQQCMVVNIRA
jgi:hypothetical protein